MKTGILAALSWFTFAASPAAAQIVTSHTEVDRWHWSISASVMQWPNLGNVETIQGNGFDELGFGLEFAAHRRIGSWHDRDIQLGVDLGFFSAESDITGITEVLVQRGVYLTPSVKMGLGESDRTWLEAGIGWYSTDFAETDCDTGGAFCSDVYVPYEASSAGGYLGLRYFVGEWAFFGLRAHYADFGEVSGIYSSDSSLKGPFYLLSFGAAF